MITYNGGENDVSLEKTKFHLMRKIMEPEVKDNDVYGLISRLCANLYHRHYRVEDHPYLPQRNNDKHLRKLKSTAYAILLNKSGRDYAKDDVPCDPILELLKHAFVLKVGVGQSSRADELEKYLNEFIDEGLESNSVTYSILQFLSCLKSIDSKDDSTLDIFHYGKPHPMLPEMYCNKGEVPPFQIYPIKSFFLPKTFEFNLKQDQDNVFKYNSAEPGSNLSLLGLFASSNSNMEDNRCNDSPSMSNMPKYLMKSPISSFFLSKIQDITTLDEKVSTFKEGIVSDLECRHQYPNILQRLSNDTSSTEIETKIYEIEYDYQEVEKLDKILEDTDKVSVISNHRTWETLGKSEPPKEVPFASESIDATLHLIKIAQSEMLINQPFRNRAIIEVTTEEFINNIKLLLLGIESSTFTYNSSTGFELKNIVIHGISSTTLENLSYEIIHWGTSFRNLSILIVTDKDTGKLQIEGLIFKALCSSIKEFLLFYHAAILRVSINVDQNFKLLKFLNKVKPLGNLINKVAKLCRCDNQKLTSLGEGIGILTHIYKEVTKVTEQNVALIFYSVLKNCCEVYFRFLQRWIFEGECTDIYEEFMIKVRPSYLRTRGHRFWTRAFNINQKSVPGFLSELTDSILQCGKTVALLRICNPKNPLCRVSASSQPQIRVCLSVGMLREQAKFYEEYVTKGEIEQGEEVTLYSAIREEKETEKKRAELVIEAQQDTLARLKKRREDELKKVIKEKSVLLKQLKDQAEEAANRKERDRNAELLADKILLDNILKQEEEAKNIGRLERENIIKYYNELAEEADRRRIHAEWRIRRMKLFDERVLAMYNMRESEYKPIEQPTTDYYSVDEQESDDLESIEKQSIDEAAESISNENSKIEEEEEESSKMELLEEEAASEDENCNLTDVKVSESSSKNKNINILDEENRSITTPYEEYQSTYTRDEENRSINTPYEEYQSIYTRDEENRSINTPDEEYQSINTPDEETRSINTQDEETRSINSRDEESRSINTRDEESRSMNTRDEESRSMNTQDEESRSMNTRDEESRSMNTQDEESRSMNTRDEESRSMNTQDEESRSMNTRDEESRSMNTQDEESRSMNTRDEESRSMNTQDEETRSMNTQDEENRNINTPDEENQNIIVEQIRTKAIRPNVLDIPGTQTPKYSIQSDFDKLDGLKNAQNATLDKITLNLLNLTVMNNMTEAQRNKLKVMQQEYGVSPNNNKSVDTFLVIENSEKNSNMSEARMNRLRNTAHLTHLNWENVEATRQHVRDEDQTREPKTEIQLNRLRNTQHQTNLNWETVETTRQHVRDEDETNEPVTEIQLNRLRNTQHQTNLNWETVESTREYVSDEDEINEPITEIQLNRLRNTRHQTNLNWETVESTKEYVSDEDETNEPITEIQLNRLRNTQHQTNLNWETVESTREYVSDEDQTNEPKTEIQLNRLRNTQHNTHLNWNESKSSEIIEKKPLTEAQINRNKIMSHFYNRMEELEHPVTKPENLTEWQKNRNRNMAHNTDRFDFELNRFADVEQLKETPMSTTTDNFTVSTCSNSLHVPSSENTPFSEITNQSDMIFTRSSTETSSEDISQTRSSKYFKPSSVYPNFIGLGSVPNTPSVETQQLTVADVEMIDTTSLQVYLEKSVVIPLTAQNRLVNNAIIKYLLTEHKMLSHLHSLRSYFFLLNGEFAKTLMQSLFTKLYEVTTPAELLNSSTLTNFLEKALVSSLSNTYANSELLSLSAMNIPTYLQTSNPEILNNLSLNYKISWPLNIIFNDIVMQQYSRVFKFLLMVGRVLWVLQEDFQILKTARKVSISRNHHKLQLYRHSMMQFMNALHTYLTCSVLHASWSEFEKKLENATTLDEVHDTHVSYIKKILSRCMLNVRGEKMHMCLSNIFKVVLKFHNRIRVQNWNESKSNETYYENLEKMYVAFCEQRAYLTHVAEKLANTGYQPHLLHFLHALNINYRYNITSQK